MEYFVDQRLQAGRQPAAARSGRLRAVTLAVPLSVALAGGAAGVLERRSLLLAGALLLGWSQLVGP
jgi:hypothetical protein